MSQLEETALLHFRAAGVIAPMREYRFAPPRRWRFDFAWPDRFLALEIEGGTWVNGAHNRGAHFESDAEKYNTGTVMGWYILRVTRNQLENGQALKWVEQALANVRPQDV